MKINRFRLLLLVGTLALAMFLVTGVYANPATEALDSINIGDTTSEDGHNLSGWSDLQSGCGWCSPDTNMRLIWGAGDTCEVGDNSASFTLDAGTGVATSLKLQHLDGEADDGFNVFVNGDPVGTYVTTPETPNVWYITEFDLSGSEYTGELTVDIQATGDAWHGCTTYGQVGFSQVELLGEPDTDGDGVIDKDDNCPDTPNPKQEDSDGDGIGDLCDNCVYTPNPGQEDADGDGIGDICKDDWDNDGVDNDDDNCPVTPNADQADADFDVVGDVCDNCVNNPNPEQEDVDADGVGDACDLLCTTTWRPPLSFPKFMMNVNATLPIKFWLDDCTEDKLRGDMSPVLKVTGPTNSETEPPVEVDVPLHIGSGGYQYIGHFRPDYPGTYTAVVYTGEQEQMSKDFVVVGAGKENGKANGNSEAKQERKENKVTGKPAGDDVEPKNNGKPPGKPAGNDDGNPDGNDKGNGKAKGKDKDKGFGKGK